MTRIAVSVNEATIRKFEALITRIATPVVLGKFVFLGFRNAEASWNIGFSFVTRIAISVNEATRRSDRRSPDLSTLIGDLCRRLPLLQHVVLLLLVFSSSSFFFSSSSSSSSSYFFSSSSSSSSSSLSCLFFLFRSIFVAHRPNFRSPFRRHAKRHEGFVAHAARAHEVDIYR